MGGRNKRVPAKAVGRPVAKSVRIISQQHTGKPAWRFSTVDTEGPFRWPKGDPEELLIVQKLHAFDSMTWADLVGKQHHFLSVTSISSAAKRRIEELDIDDAIENLFSFHLAGKPRVIALRYGDTASLLWYDPDHQVAPSTKRHT